MVFHLSRCFPAFLTGSAASFDNCDIILLVILILVPTIVVLLLLWSFSRGLTTESDAFASTMAFNRHYRLRVSLGLCSCDRFVSESCSYHTRHLPLLFPSIVASVPLPLDFFTLLPCSLRVSAFRMFQVFDFPSRHLCDNLCFILLHMAVIPCATFTTSLLLWVPWCHSIYSWYLFTSKVYAFALESFERETFLV